MGLDMYLTGNKFFMSMERRKEDGFEVESHNLRLGYWRKHPNLHGYIVQNFADGVDECQRIDLDADCLRQLIEAVKDPVNLPETAGFFFGQSYGTPDEIEDDVRQLTGALQWLEEKVAGEWRSVSYHASW